MMMRRVMWHWKVVNQYWCSCIDGTRSTCHELKYLCTYTFRGHSWNKITGELTHFYFIHTYNKERAHAPKWETKMHVTGGRTESAFSHLELIALNRLMESQRKNKEDFINCLRCARPVENENSLTRFSSLEPNLWIVISFVQKISVFVFFNSPFPFFFPFFFFFSFSSTIYLVFSHQ